MAAIGKGRSEKEIRDRNRVCNMEDRNSDNGLWVFGYGSLCWHPGFAYKKSSIGYVKGFARRFWQGNTTHRGTSEKPGRVATLVEDKEGTVHGRAFQVLDGTAFPYLEKRECTLGGYISTISTFFSREDGRKFPVIIYIATNQNEHWLGEAPLHAIANQISECAGPGGHNIEYLLRLAEFMHRYMPDANDEHLFTLELMVRSRIKEQNLCLTTLMGNRDFSIYFQDLEDRAEDRELVENAAVNNIRENSFQFVARVTPKTLRCLNI